MNIIYRWYFKNKKWTGLFEAPRCNIHGNSEQRDWKIRGYSPSLHSLPKICQKSPLIFLPPKKRQSWSYPLGIVWPLSMPNWDLEATSVHAWNYNSSHHITACFLFPPYREDSDSRYIIHLQYIISQNESSDFTKAYTPGAYCYRVQISKCLSQHSSSQ